jgi:hypothetical protein
LVVIRSCATLEETSKAGAMIATTLENCTATTTFRCPVY